ncbi:dihydrolipoyllysine-residue acetyltransferase component of pyruvate dehydrogenase complex [Allostella sp. ATCC 35155]|nr:dihydrolipoyllysine-residue acetyltransferase component of pyruvate dehydrogenase complex [Stella sp. ATCC 35155]
MPIPILMPALSPTMTEGNLAKWHKKEGDTVKAGDVLAEIETDKATMEVEAVDEGTIGRILVAEGAQGVQVNAPIAILLEEGEDASALDGDEAKPAPKAAAPAAAPAPAPQSAPAPQPAAAPAAPRESDERIVASPLARRMAAQAGVDLATLSGSGPNGRIVKSDIEAALGKGPAKPATAAAAKAEPAAAAPTPAPRPQPAAAAAGLGKDQVALLTGNIPYRLDAHTSMRKTIARRLSESKQQVPHFYLSVDCTIDRLLATRKELNGRSDAYKLSVNDFVIRASALALRKVPQANASWSDDGLLIWEQVDVSVAVAIPNGLITPIVKKADQKGLATISEEMRDLGQRAKEGKLKPEEFQGGTFSVSNLGMFGIPNFSAIINPPQACILAVGAGEQRPVVKDGALAIATQMTCTLSVDHRVVDGAVGARFLAAFKGYIEDPLSMLL